MTPHPAQRVTREAPAKINLNLLILSRRPDGYHELDTLIAKISLADIVTVDITGHNHGISLHCDDPAIPCDQSNLAYRAATAFFEATSRPASCHITLKKDIPSGAGLGGGSSDAAAVLHALNDLHNRPLTTQELAHLGAAIGSDVPVFIHPWPIARCTGRGEIIHPVKLELGFLRTILLIKPAFPVPTPWAYKTYAQLRQADSQKLSATTRTCHLPWGELRNDLEPAVFSKYLWLPAVVEWLQQQPGVAHVRMSGSGSTIFALFQLGADPQQTYNRCREKFGTATFTRLCEILES